MKTSNKLIPVQIPPARKTSYSIFGSLTALAAGVALLGGQANARAQADNFNDGTDTAPTVDWAHVDVIDTALGGTAPQNTYDASTFQYHLTALPSPLPGAVGPARIIAVPPDVYTDFYVSVDIVAWDNTYAQAFGLMARGKEFGPSSGAPGDGVGTDGYFFGCLNATAFGPGLSYVTIVRVEDDIDLNDVHGSGPRGDSLMAVELDPAKDYRFVFMGHGTQLEGRVYELPNVTTPIAVVSGPTATDATVLTSGQSGLVAFNVTDNTAAEYTGPVDVTFDNYYASARCPMTITDMVVKDNFNDGNDTAPTVAWQRYDPIAGAVGFAQNTFSFPGGNTYRLEAPTQPFNPALGQGRVASSAPGVQTDFRIAADIVNWDDAIDQNIGLLARLGSIGLGTTTGYSFTYDVGGSGDCDMASITGEVPTGLTLNGPDEMIMVPGKSYRFVFSGKGSELRGMVFELPETMNPIVDVVATDATYASGQPALLASAATDTDTADVTFDNYSDTALVAPAVLLAFGAGSGGEFTVNWPANIECVWILESTTTLGPTAVWTQVPTTTTAVDAAKLVYDPGTGLNTYTAAAPVATSPNTYYRLKQL